MPGNLSVVICAHNSAERLRPTLEHLADQDVPTGLSWEVLVIDNNSTDETAAVAKELWRGPVPLYVIHEHQLGLSHARWRGIYEAQYEIVSFVDDDNWVCPTWVATVAAIMEEHSEVGACGGKIEGVYETPPPPWFAVCCRPGFALGPQSQTTGDITETRGNLWGAGLSIRRQILLQLKEYGFHSLLVDRRGTALSGGEDLEICHAIRQLGWRLWYDERLTMQHFMPAQRMQWDYVRRLHRGVGASRLVLGLLYREMEAPPPTSWPRRINRTWGGQVLLTLWRIVKTPLLLLRYIRDGEEGDPDILILDRHFGHLSELLRQRRRYPQIATELRRASWLRAPKATIGHSQ